MTAATIVMSIGIAIGLICMMSLLAWLSVLIQDYIPHGFVELLFVELLAVIATVALIAAGVHVVLFGG